MVESTFIIEIRSRIGVELVSTRPLGRPYADLQGVQLYAHMHVQICSEIAP